MKTNKTNPAVDVYINNAEKWQEETKKLRKIALDCGLAEELKWGKPCYTYNGKNIVIIQGFKEYCALLFFKGYLLNNENSLLVKTGENTRVGRQIRFNSIGQIIENREIIKHYIFNAIEVEKSGLKPD